MWKRAVRCKLEGEGGWNQGKEAAYWKYRQDRLRSCRKQGTMGAGTVCLLREAKTPALGSEPRVCPHLLNPFLKSTLLQAPGSERLVPCHPTPNMSPRG